eukprot:TRINITY_DN398_c0_g1_i2.p1 TRINITY_DN398_c0_g1~~TRINITY_DN398_c0_g1_i2.p1  ORF type:complete len:143 (-),score=18.25 TRINITY_DN398_c0_g1_i2:873-1301(-)
MTDRALILNEEEDVQLHTYWLPNEIQWNVSLGPKPIAASELWDQKSWTEGIFRPVSFHLAKNSSWKRIDWSKDIVSVAGNAGAHINDLLLEDENIGHLAGVNGCCRDGAVGLDVVVMKKLTFWTVSICNSMMAMKVSLCIIT